MLPEDAQALMAKMLLIFFGTVLICMSKVRADEIKNPNCTQNSHPFIAQNH